MPKLTSPATVAAAAKVRFLKKVRSSMGLALRSSTTMKSAVAMAQVANSPMIVGEVQP